MWRLLITSNEGHLNKVDSLCHYYTNMAQPVIGPPELTHLLCHLHSFHWATDTSGYQNNYDTTIISVCMRYTVSLPDQLLLLIWLSLISDLEPGLQTVGLNIIASYNCTCHRPCVESVNDDTLSYCIPSSFVHSHEEHRSCLVYVDSFIQ